MRAGRPEPHTLAGAYALDALAGTDRARFERHLARCEQCAQEISELREATARLATAAAAEPPPGLTERALAAAARTRQLPPAIPKDAASWPARHPTRTRTARPPISRSGPAPACLGAEAGARGGRGRYSRRRAPRGGRRHRGAPGR